MDGNCVEKYEKIRDFFVGKTYTVPQGNGINILMSRGVYEWAKVSPKNAEKSESTYTKSDTIYSCTEIVRLLANLIAGGEKKQ